MDDATCSSKKVHSRHAVGPYSFQGAVPVAQVHGAADVGGHVKVRLPLEHGVRLLVLNSYSTEQKHHLSRTSYSSHRCPLVSLICSAGIPGEMWLQQVGNDGTRGSYTDLDLHELHEEVSLS